MYLASIYCNLSRTKRFKIILNSKFFILLNNWDYNVLIMFLKIHTFFFRIELNFD